MGETGFILVREPEPKGGDCIKAKLKDSSDFVRKKFGDIIDRNVFDVALEYIEQLERERDAAVEQLKEVDKEDLFRCSHCIHDELCNDGLTSCVDCDKDCPCHTCENGSNWQWCGVPQEVE